MTDVAGGLITLEYAKTGLAWADNNTARDADLTAYIQAATPVIESLVGPVLQQTKTIMLDGGKTGVLLPGRINAASSVTAVRVDGGVWSGYTVNPDSGVIYAGPTWAGMKFPPGIRNVEVDVTVGYAATVAPVTLTYPDGTKIELSRQGDVVTMRGTPVNPQTVTVAQPIPDNYGPRGFVGQYQATSGNLTSPGTWYVSISEIAAGGALGIIPGSIATGPYAPFTAQWLADLLPGGTPIPQGLQFATRELVRYWVQIGKQAPSGGILDLQTDSSADPIDPFAIPRRVRQLCAPFMGGGFA